MKKFLVLIITVLITFAGCSSKAENASKSIETTIASEATEAAASNSSNEDIDTSDLSSEELRDIYLNAYSDKAKADKFITDSEAEFYEEHGFSVRNDTEGYITYYDELYNIIDEYFYPILLDKNNMAYVTEGGTIRLYRVDEKSTDGSLLEKVHYEYSSETAMIESTESYAVVDDDSQIQLWKFGEKISEIDLPEGAVYAGKSRWVGYIFRVDSDVYAVEISEEGELNSTPIAHGVEKVICADYKLDSDAWSQPLFQMQDGSIKAYCRWNSEKDEEKKDDDPSFLHQINESWLEK